MRQPRQLADLPAKVRACVIGRVRASRRDTALTYEVPSPPNDVVQTQTPAIALASVLFYVSTCPIVADRTGIYFE